MARTLAIDVVSDVICPWCYIGKRRLDKAVAAFGGQAGVRVHWHSFQLNPNMPREGITRRKYRTRKFGSWKRSLELDANVTTVGQEEGIEFNFARVKRTPSTVDAHRIISLAGEHGCQDAVVESLFAAYFSQGVDIGDTDTLIELATNAGLDRQVVQGLLSDHGGMTALATDKELSQQHKVTSVPFFIVNNEATLSGAQSPETFLRAFELVSSHG